MLDKADKKILLSIARQAVEFSTKKLSLPTLDLSDLPDELRELGASFVTLTRFGELRGCIGTLEAHQPIALDVQEHAAAAAVDDYRFPPVRSEEVNEINIEISLLTPNQPLKYSSPQDLLNKLKPGVDGVILKHGFNRATFLPQVWEKLPGKEEFLSHLCMKMGASPDLWRTDKPDVLIYQVEEFKED